MTDFAHLHLHTIYSFLDGYVRPKGLGRVCRERGITSCAVTDHGHMGGALRVYTDLRKAGVKPILGMEAWVGQGHLVLLALDDLGYANLRHLATEHARGPLTMKSIASRARGLYALTACVLGHVPAALRAHDPDRALKTLEQLKRVFGRDNLGVELQFHGPMASLAPGLCQLARDLDLDIVATNDVHYLDPEDAGDQNVLMAIRQGKRLGDPGLFQHPGPDYWLKSHDDMLDGQGLGFRKAVENTLKVADRVTLDLDLGHPDLPKFADDEDQTLSALGRRAMMDRGLAQRPEYVQRFHSEMAVIQRMGYSGYFLIVQDFCNEARRRGIPVGPGRGCLTGDSLVFVGNGDVINLSDVSVGDFVTARSGEHKKVVETFEYDVNERLVELRCYMGDSSPITMTTDHRVFAEKTRVVNGWNNFAPSTKGSRRKYEEFDGHVVEVEAGDLEVGDGVFFPFPVRDIESVISVDLGDFADDADDLMIYETTPSNIPFHFSIRDIHKKTGVTRQVISRLKSGDIRSKTSRAYRKVVDYILTVFGSLEDWRSYHDLHSSVIQEVRRHVPFDEKLAYVMGLWTANGWMRSRDGRTWGLAFHSSHTEKLERAVEWLRGLGLEPSFNRSRKTRLVQITVSSPVLCSWWRSMFSGYEYRAQTKTIPDVMMMAPDNMLLSFVRGYTDGDGHVEETRVRWTTTSKSLAYRLKYALLSLRIPASVSWFKRTDDREEFKNSGSGYTIQAPIIGVLSDLWPENKASLSYQYKILEDGVLCRVRDLEIERRRTKVHDLRVEGEPSYLTTSGLVHNSGAGSLVAYALGITDLDPLEHGLFFERFLNPERVSMPDFDIDFAQGRRQEIIDYVRDKYGHDHVGQIATYMTLGPKAAIKDVARVMDIPFAEVNALTKVIPSAIRPKTLEEEEMHPFDLAMTLAPDLVARSEEDEDYARLLAVARRLTGCCRQTGKHAGGVVIGRRPIVDYTPLTADGRTAYDMKDVEAAGLVKFDFLGVKTLDVIDLAARDVGVDPRSLPLDDVDVYRDLGRGRNWGVFQVESPGMSRMCVELEPERFGDIVAAVALYRPGPLESGMVDGFIARKHGRQDVVYPHPSLETVLADTHGTIVYQEQVMQAAQILAGYTLGGADLLRRAMGKKIPEEMHKQRRVFVDGCLKNGIDEKLAVEIFDAIEYFSGYSFNRSHSAGYALISYQTAWLRYHHPAAFTAALLTIECGDKDVFARYVREARLAGIEYLPPDVNESESGFRVEDGRVRWGLGAVKGLGEAQIPRLVAERPYTDLFDLARRSGLSAQGLKTLIAVGALDRFDDSRSRLTASVDAAMRGQRQAANDAVSGQTTMDLGVEHRLVDGDEWTVARRLEAEYRLLGVYVTGHPASELPDDVITPSTWDRDGEVSGVVVDVFERVAKKSGRRWAKVTIEDEKTHMTTLVFSDVLEEYEPLLVVGNLLTLHGDVNHDDELVVREVEECKSSS